MLKTVCQTVLAVLLTMLPLGLMAQARIGGNIYGGGNQGNVEGNSTATIYEGDLNDVFGGARMANVGGRAFVNIDGAHASGYILINHVYGGNDIAGTIGSSTVPTELTKVGEGVTMNHVTDSWNAFVRTSSTQHVDSTGEAGHKTNTTGVYIGQLFGGGNGDYSYSDRKANDKYDVTVDGMTIEVDNKPELARTYIEIVGGSIVNAFGGGNNVTVTDSTVICVDNPSDVVSSVKKDGQNLLESEDRLIAMSLNPGYSYATSDAFQIGSFFGGNNKAEMKIRPRWKLLNGSIRNLYSGGNRGDMSSPEGLLLQIPAYSNIVVDNLYGGCRMANVIPRDALGRETTASSISADDDGNALFIPGGFAARSRVLGGDVNNVYGGNDITGTVSGGSTVGIYTSVRGNVYGGGNGSYPYTDNATLKDDPTYGDFYYTIPEGKTSVQALNAYRPHAEQVSIYVAGTSEAEKTIVHGSIFCGGNSASLSSAKTNPKVELKVGSHVIADNVYLGNNGEHMVETNEKDDTHYIEGVLRTYSKTLQEVDPVRYAGNTQPFSTLPMTDSITFSQYMEGAVMTLMPSVVFAKLANNDPSDYIPYSSYFGSIFCGGNVGSMRVDNRKTTLNFSESIIVYDKVVGGCNNANVAQSSFNATYEGGLIGTPEAVTGDKLELNFRGLKIQPRRWIVERDADYNIVYRDDDGQVTTADLGHVTYQKDGGGNELEWNTVSSATKKQTRPVTSGTGSTTAADLDRRLFGGNIYGGCYNSGHVNGNVVINMDASVIDRLGEHAVFDQVEQEGGEAKLYGHDSYNITQRVSGVLLDKQGMDVLGSALNVFGGGYGMDSEIWGSTTINLNAGYTFQLFGGGEQGVIGKPNDPEDSGSLSYTFNGKTYRYNPKYSCTINLKGGYPGVARDADGDHANMAAAEFLYGGGFEGPVCGNTIVNLGDGRVFNSFAGSCNADILGHTETYVGRQPTADGTGFEAGFPYIRDHIYGGNDLGGEIKGSKDFTASVKSTDLPYVHGYTKPEGSATGTSPVLTASAYTEYVQGRVDYIFGGCYGDYDYKDRELADYTYDNGLSKEGFTKPRMGNAFVNFRPNTYDRNVVKRIHGAGQGHLKGIGVDSLQNSSYILIDIPSDAKTTYQTLDVFGTGAYSGIGMGVDSATVAAAPDRYSAIIDLFRGVINNVYGGSYEEGFTRRAIVNVPRASTIKVQNLFGGAFGADPLYPCDVYEAQVNYHSESATVAHNIYGGNNNADRTLYGQVNIDAPVWQDKASGYLAKVFGAGYGQDTWSQYTEVNLLDGAQVYEVYGGGEKGKVINVPSLLMWQKNEKTAGRDLDLSMPGYFECGLNHDVLVHETRLGGKYNTNVHINEGATVVNYAYGGGLGDTEIPCSGDVMGTSYIDLLGGKVLKDIYAAGTSGAVRDSLGVTKDGFEHTDGQHVNGFTASSNAYIEGGTCRNVYGGGWEGAVGYHSGSIENPYTDDIPGETHVVIGKIDGASFVDGIPAIERNAYGGGEGGAVFGTTNITLNRGYIGYRYFESKALADADHVAFANEVQNTTADPDDIPTDVADGGGCYQEKLHDETWKGDGTNRLNDSGNIFGGGYIDNSSVDQTNVLMLGGVVRNALFGGGEIAAIGRGVITASGTNNSVRTLKGIYKAGHTSVKLYDGQVHRNVFGGGRGYNNLGEGGTLYSDGYVFGQTEVDIYGGEVGTDEELENGNGNVFGGGDIGYVYSAYEEDGKLYVGIKDGSRYDDNYEGYYYAYQMGDNHYIPANYVYSLTDPNWLMEDGEYILTEDCKVLIEPHAKVNDIRVLIDIKDKQMVNGVEQTVILYSRGTSMSNEQFAALPQYIRDTLTINTHYAPVTSVTIGKRTYVPGEYVETDTLNTMQNKNADISRWSCLDTRGIIIHNAIFAGGNTSSGSSKVYANATSIFGNATASVHDIYHRDLITVGTGHTGGLYGDGNLTFVDGYRCLNITNYGTDYYTIEKEINIDQYHALPEREAAYYELRYKCEKSCVDKDGTRYTPASSDGQTAASTISADDLITLFQGIYFNSSGDTKALSESDDKTGWTALLKVDGTPDPAFWTENGVCSRYAGRIMNTIQRSDFCGVFGSRMVMQGAQDRVPEIVDYTNYTINRVREVSLNKKKSVIASDLTKKGDGSYADKEKAEHGNYFGIYNIVNFLGALTSDLDFGSETAGEGDARTTDNTDTETYGPDPDTDGQSFYDWKKKHTNERKRNNGNSHNKVALASGVYLELTTEESTGDDLYEKEWGTITGVIELDLINVQTGIGGGFVYARNEHGVRTKRILKHTTLTKLNENAITKADFTYTTEDSSKKEWQTSGNFVHSTQTIIDDCYNISGKYFTNYNKPDGVPAHYWYIKGSVYVYDQYISAYTGAPNAYSESVDIPLTITAASHGTMKLLNVQPSLYAYYSSKDHPLEDGKKVIINDVTYYKNDPISYWDWYLLSASEKELFVPKTYVTAAECSFAHGNTKFPAGTYPEGTVLLPDDYTALKALNDSVFHEEKKDSVAFDFVFRSSNNMSHHTGYMLTYKVNNPTDWDTWYTKFDDAAHAKQQTAADGYNNGPTYHLTDTEGSLLGQRSYEVSNIISKEVYDTYQSVVTNHSDVIPTSDPTDAHYDADLVQATFEEAYVVTEKVSVTEGDRTHHLNPGAIISATYKNANSLSGYTSPAFVCTSTIQLSSTEYIYLNSKMSGTEKQTYINDVTADIRDILPAAADVSKKKIADLTDTELSGLTVEQKKKLATLLALRTDIDEHIVPAYYCTSPGLYGGNYYQGGRNYRGLEAWSSMSAEDRKKFEFNYDALDLLIDSLYSHNADGTSVRYAEGEKYQYDSKAATLAAAEANSAGYSLTRPVDYTATFNNTSLSLTNAVEVKRNGTTMTTSTVNKDDELSRTAFESIPNEKRHYSSIKAESAGTYYVVNAPFQIGNTPYAVGSSITSTTYESLGQSEKANVTRFKFSTPGTYYYCREDYKIGSNGEGKKVADITANGTGDDVGLKVLAETAGDSISVGDSVHIGTVISEADYTRLVNNQVGFTIHGIAPTETSTLYVSRNSDIFDLSKEKIITVIYQYDYEESDASGNITPISERHVVNIHVQFKSGIPIVEDIKAPQIIIPGDNVSLREPNVTPGAYEITGGGWELFESINDAESHTNGIEYSPNFDPLYWYQDGYYVAYYAKTYLGKTYSNNVQVSVANYHDLKRVMDDKEHHYYVDNPDVRRDSKVYINDYGTTANGLDLLKQFFDLSMLNGSAVDTDANGLITTIKDTDPAEDSPFKGHALLNSHVSAGQNLEFFLRTDLDYSVPSGLPAWEPIASKKDLDGKYTECFEGTLHGDGHSVNGLTSSLFGHLCGSVYNLGVTGSFTSAGVADEGPGYVENCWTRSTVVSGSGSDKPFAVFGKPDRGCEDQVVNCYFWSGNKDLYTVATDEQKGIIISGGDRGTARAMSDTAFYNGEVTYDLNGFYLNKRYYDRAPATAFGGSPIEYRYLLPAADGTLPEDMSKGKYPSSYAFYPLEAAPSSYGYVENRFADGDFRYAGGSIPESSEMRQREIIVGNTTTTVFVPIWPDDYIFFGQALNYDHVDGRTHQDNPSAVLRSDSRLLTTAAGNRVYRAPAYFRSKRMDVAHFNSAAVFAQSKKDDATTIAYKDMTAIDFTGYNDLDLAQSLVTVTVGSSSVPAGSAVKKNFFFPPLLDDDGLVSFQNIDLTSNLLAYSHKPAEDTAAGKTGTVLRTQLPDVAFAESTANPDYRAVPINSVSVRGHWVQLSGDVYQALRDHFLVDRQDFNCPIAYTFDEGKRMWHQRRPTNYVDRTKGWEAISLPFSAELVSTQQKGEITHFYSGSAESANSTEAKIGHEYWLRAYTGIDTDKSTSTLLAANFIYPNSADDGSAVIDKKTVTNTFLWDYYYSETTTPHHQDQNTDEYQTYYERVRGYENYPLLTAAKPYIIGFPGVTYYEFDLSGNFQATTTANPDPAKLAQQVITFAAAPTDGSDVLTIGVSDDETRQGVTPSGCAYTFRPSYMNETFPAATASTYTLNTAGSSFDALPATGDAVTVPAFRPYFTAAGSGAGGTPPLTRSIMFVNNDSFEPAMPHASHDDGDTPGTLNITPGRRMIVVASSLHDVTTVQIVNVSGSTIALFDLQPGETVDTHISAAGVYIVRTTDGRFLKKLSIK